MLAFTQEPFWLYPCGPSTCFPHRATIWRSFIVRRSPCHTVAQYSSCRLLLSKQGGHCIEVTVWFCSGSYLSLLSVVSNSSLYTISFDDVNFYAIRHAIFDKVHSLYLNIHLCFYVLSSMPTPQENPWKGFFWFLISLSFHAHIKNVGTGMVPVVSHKEQRYGGIGGADSSFQAVQLISTHRNMN